MRIPQINNNAAVNKHYAFSNPSYYRMMANKIANEPYHDFTEVKKDKIPKIKYWIDKYKEITDNLIIVLSSDEGEFFKEYTTRLNPKYVKKQRRKIHKFVKTIEQLGIKKGALFLTITASPRKFSTIKEHEGYLMKKWNILLTRIRKDYGKHIKAICVKQAHKNGFIHLHIILFGISFIPKPYINKTIPKKEIINLKTVRKIRYGGIWGAYNYIIRYITRQDNLTKYMLFSLNARTFSLSQLPIISLINIKNNSNEQTSENAIFVEFSGYTICEIYEKYVKSRLKSPDATKEKTINTKIYKCNNYT